MARGGIPDGPLVSYDDIVKTLRELGINRGDVVYIHSSLSSMGFVQGGADTVIDAFLHVLGSEGTFCVPTIVYAAQGPRPPFQVASTPSEVGRITETTRLRREARRSNNPTHSVAAIGAQAEEITTGHDCGRGRPSPWGELAFGHESPWQSFYDLDATCVLLGVDWEVNTMFHYQQCLFIEPFWSEFTVEPVFPYYDRTPMGRALEDAGIVRTQQLGAAVVTCVNSQPMVDTTSALLAENPARFFAEGESVDFVRWYRRLSARRRRLRAGAASLPVDPPLPSAEVSSLEPLHVRALVLEAGGNAAAIVLCDLHSLGRRHVAAARQQVEELTGIPSAHVMIACTHNHAGPDAADPVGETAEQIRADIVPRIAEVVALARDRVEDVRAGTSCAQLEGIAVNRRMRLPDGSVLTLRRFVPSSWHQVGKCDVGPVDRGLVVLRLENLMGEPVALLTTLACHNESGGMHSPIGISGDFFGHAMLTLEKLYPGCTAMVGFGAGGDVDFDFLPYLNLSRARAEYPFQRTGRLLAAQVAAASERAEVDDGGSLEVHCENVPVQLRSQARLLVSAGESESAEVQVIGIGDLAVVGVPGELFAETALRIGASHSQAGPILCGLANGDVGYIPPPSAYGEGGYELEPGHRSRVDERAEPEITKAISRLLERLR